MLVPHWDSHVQATSPRARPSPARHSVGFPQGPFRCEEPAELANLTQNWFFSAATANAFTTVFAGFAFTIVTFPNISRLPAFVAGFTRVFTRQSPGTVKTEFFFSSAAATPARASMTFAAWDFLSSHVPARDSARAPLVIAFPFMALGAIAVVEGKDKYSH